MVLGAHHCFLPRSVLLMCLWRFPVCRFYFEKRKKRLHVFKRMMMFNKKEIAPSDETPADLRHSGHCV